MEILYILKTSTNTKLGYYKQHVKMTSTHLSPKDHRHHDEVEQVHKDTELPLSSHFQLRKCDQCDQSDEEN